MSESTRGWKVSPGCLNRLAPPGSTLCNPDDAELWEAIVDAFLRVRGRAGGETFQLAHLIRELGDDGKKLHDYCRAFKGRDEIPGTIARNLPGRATALVMDRTCYALSGSDYEVFSTHAMVGSEHWLLDIARYSIKSGRSCADQAWKTARRALELWASEDLDIAPEAPILACQSKLAELSGLRRHLVSQGISYAFRASPHQGFRDRPIDFDSDDVEDRIGGHETASTYFDQAQARSKPSPRPTVLEVADLVDPQGTYNTPECLVEVANGFHVLTRPSPWRRDRLEKAAELARAVAQLPQEPLSHLYRANTFHHPNDAPWENVLMNVALARAAAPTS